MISQAAPKLLASVSALGGARIASLVAMIGVFIADLLTPADFIIGVFYLVAMIEAAQTLSHPWLRGVSAAAVTLTILAGAFGAPPLAGTSPWVAVTNRGLTVIALLAVTVVLDRMILIQDRKRMLRHEVDHRSKNILASVVALLRLMPRQDPKHFISMVEARIFAMARIHLLLAEAHWSGADLRSLLNLELKPYDDGSGRLRLEGPSVQLRANVAQPVSMVVHELATNAAKYGAFSASGGSLVLAWRIEPESLDLVLVWQEAGGPMLDGAPRQAGFGTRLIMGLTRQVGGSMERDWSPCGLRCVLRLPGRSHAQAG